MKLDKGSPVPIYYQLIIDLERRILEKEWKIGELISSESELAKYYNVSRVTVRQSLNKLVHKNIIRKKRGQGSFLLNFPESNEDHSVNLPPSVKTKLMHFGIKVSAEVLSIEEIINPTYAEQLKLNHDEPIIQITRLFTSGKTPYSLNQSWLPSKQVPHILKKGLINNSVAQTLEIRYKTNLNSSDNWIEAITPPEEIASTLKVDPNTVLMCITTIEKNSQQLIVEYAKTYWIKEQVRFHFSQYHAEPRTTK